MGRYNFAAQRVHQHATQLLERSRLAVPPPWFSAIGDLPPSARLTRPVFLPETESKQKAPKKRKSRAFRPLPLKYEEDELRWEYFNDHPWDLARPRIVLETDGRDLQKWDWGLELDFAYNRPQQDTTKLGRSMQQWDRIWASQCGRPINGETVVQRQLWLMRELKGSLIENRKKAEEYRKKELQDCKDETKRKELREQHEEIEKKESQTPPENMEASEAYDKARKEYYRIMHHREIQRRVAREEALAVGAYFGPGPMEIGMQMEDKSYERYKVWAFKEAERLRQMAMQGSGGAVVEEAETAQTRPGGEESGERSTSTAAAQ